MTDLRWVDVDGSDPEHLRILLDLQATYFGEYEYVPDEIRRWCHDPSPRDGIVHRQQLLFVDDELAGYVIFDTNLPRRIVIGHFMAVLPECPLPGLGKVVEYHVRDAGRLDAAGFGVEILAYGAECEEEMLPLFKAWGFTLLPADYAEPYHGRTWPEYGEPTFFHRRLVALPLPGQDLDIPAVTHATAAAFLLDHYRLPTDHPVVVRCLGSANHA